MWFVCLGAIGLTRSKPEPSVFGRPDAPLAACDFLREEVKGEVSSAKEIRLFNPYNAGPWLLWLVGPPVKLYIDPRNNLGAEMLSHYVSEVRTKPSKLNEVFDEHDVDLAMVDLADGTQQTIAQTLREDLRWSMIHFDGRFVIYGRLNAGINEIIEKETYHLIRGSLEFEPMLGQSDRLVRSEIEHLRQRGPAIAGAAEGYWKLVQQEGPPPRVRSGAERGGPGRGTAPAVARPRRSNTCFSVAAASPISGAHELFGHWVRAAGQGRCLARGTCRGGNPFSR